MNLFPHADWSRQASIYEVNIRQYTAEGSLQAMAAHLPRLQKMGVDILWFMPIQPIGRLKRKGTLGSYYAIADYTAVNPEFGTLADFKALVQQAHALGMKVILDWVANHTAWDHVWTRQHPQWYLKNEKGEIHSYLYDNGAEIEDWSDVCGLDYQQAPLWTAMTEACCTGCVRPMWTAFAAMSLAWCQRLFGNRRGRRWNGSSPCSCWPNGRTQACTPKPLT